MKVIITFYNGRWELLKYINRTTYHCILRTKTRKECIEFAKKNKYDIIKIERKM